MADTYTPAREKVSLTPKEEVELDWLEAQSAGEQFWDPALDRVRELGIAEGRHYHQLINSYAGSISMLSFNLPQQPESDGTPIRQSIVSVGMLVHHYLFNFSTGEIALINQEVSVDTATNKAVVDAMTPPLISYSGGNHPRVFMCSGALYNELVLEQADHLNVFYSPEASAQFVKDTGRFTMPGSAIHTQPDIESRTYSLDENSFRLT